jgi:hypothetical protein
MSDNIYLQEKQMELSRYNYDHLAEQARVAAEAKASRSRLNRAVRVSRPGFMGQVRRLLHVPGF